MNAGGESASANRSLLRLVREADPADDRTASAALNPWLGKSVTDMFRRGVADWPSQVAVIDGEMRLSFAELDEQVQRAAGYLRSFGVTGNSRVGLSARSSWVTVTYIYAVLQLGATLVPVNPSWESRERMFVLQHAGIDVLIAEDVQEPTSVSTKRVPTLRHELPLAVPSKPLRGPVRGTIPRTQPGTGEMLFYTWKHGDYALGVRVDPSAALGVAYYLGEALGIVPGDRHLNLISPYHSSGIVDVLLAMHQRGAAIVLLRHFDVETAARMAVEHQCTSSGGPALWIERVVAETLRLAAAENANVALRRVWSVPYSPALDEAASGRVRQYSCYGFTEASNLVTISTAPAHGDAPNGDPLPGVAVKIIDPVTGRRLPPGRTGEICFRGWNLTTGYHREPRRLEASTDDEGYFHTGDFGQVNEEGGLRHVSRGPRFVRVGGELVSLKEVERILNDWELVSRITVISRFHPRWGEVPVAIVSPAGPELPTFDEMREYCRGRLAAFKVPRWLVTLDEEDWPLTLNGNVDTERLRVIVERAIPASTSA